MAGLTVMKFGGTSVADAQCVKRVARRIVDQRERGNRVVAVLSARGKMTDELIAMADEVSETPDPREMDMLLSTGERISCALCAMAIHDLGHHAISLTGSQAGIVTDSSHTKARILDVRADRIVQALDDDRIVLVAGFQGVSTTSSDVTTLGRGGSDTTAVALAAAVGADVCEIYTDVSGVYTADPRIVPDARKLDRVSFEEMLEMAASGAGVLQLRSVEYARNHGVRIHCRSSFEDGPGTVVLGEGENAMEQPLITAVTHTTAEAKITLAGVPDEPGAAARIFEAMAAGNVNVDMIVQNEPTSAGGRAEISFTVPREDLRAALDALDAAGRRQLRRADRRRGDGQGLDRRRGHALAPGRGGEGVRRARRRGREHRDDLDLADQDLLRDPARARRAGGALPARRRSSCRARARSASSSRSRRRRVRLASARRSAAVCARFRSRYVTISTHLSARCGYSRTSTNAHSSETPSLRVVAPAGGRSAVARYSPSRRAYVLRGVGRHMGPVLRVDRRPPHSPPFDGVERRGRASVA